MTRTTLLDALRAYLNAWNAPTVDARLSLLYQAVTDDVVYADPHAPSRVEGRVGLAALMDSFRARYAHTLLPTAEPQHHHGIVRLPWRLAASEADVLSTGLLVADSAPDGRLRWIAHFVDAA